MLQDTATTQSGQAQDPPAKPECYKTQPLAIRPAQPKTKKNRILGQK